MCVWCKARQRQLLILSLREHLVSFGLSGQLAACSPHSSCKCFIMVCVVGKRKKNTNFDLQLLQWWDKQMYLYQSIFVLFFCFVFFMVFFGIVLFFFQCDRVSFTKKKKKRIRNIESCLFSYTVVWEYMYTIVWVYCFTSPKDFYLFLILPAQWTISENEAMWLRRQWTVTFQMSFGNSSAGQFVVVLWMQCKFCALFLGLSSFENCLSFP